MHLKVIKFPIIASVHILCVENLDITSPAFDTLCVENLDIT